jgi:hypothetical protein
MNYYYGSLSLNPDLIQELDDKYKNLDDVPNKKDLQIHNLILVAKTEDELAIKSLVINTLKFRSFFVIIDTPNHYSNSKIALKVIDLFHGKYNKFFKRDNECNWRKIASKINKISKSRHELAQDVSNIFKWTSIILCIVSIILLFVVLVCGARTLDTISNMNEILEGVRMIKNFQTQLHIIESKVGLLDLALLLTGKN